MEALNRNVDACKAAWGTAIFFGTVLLGLFGKWVVSWYNSNGESKPRASRGGERLVKVETPLQKRRMTIEDLTIKDMQLIKQQVEEVLKIKKSGKNKFEKAAKIGISEEIFVAVIGGRLLSDLFLFGISLEESKGRNLMKYLQRKMRAEKLINKDQQLGKDIEDLLMIQSYQEILDRELGKTAAITDFVEFINDSNRDPEIFEQVLFKTLSKLRKDEDLIKILFYAQCAQLAFNFIKECSNS